MTTVQHIEARLEQVRTITEDLRQDSLQALPVNALEQLMELRAQLEQLEGLLVIQARQQRHSWEVIGTALEVSKQAANKKWGRLQVELTDELPRRSTPVVEGPAPVEQVPGQLELPAEELEEAYPDSMSGWCKQGKHHRCAHRVGGPQEGGHTTLDGKVWRCACDCHQQQEPAAKKRALIVIPCGASKSGKTKLAQDLYTGQQFKLGLEAAKALVEKLGGPDRAEIRILSAKHGLLHPHQRIQPYERKLTKDDVYGTLPTLIGEQLAQLDPPTIYALTPKLYTTMLTAGMRERGRETQVIDRLADTKGIGEQRAILAQIKAGSW